MAYTPESLKQLFTSFGLSSFRADQVMEWLYSKDVRSYDEMTNLPAAMRDQLKLVLPLHETQIADIRYSADGTTKLLLRFSDGALAETVILPSNDGRLTVCCSSQSGCPMGCAFCATGQAGFTRNLLPGEIVDQVMIAQNQANQRATNVVFMGQGEPFMNYDNVVGALHILNNSRLINLGARKITVSTCGIPKQILRFSQEPEQFTLAVSLHSAIQQTRDVLMPGVRTFPLDMLRQALHTYIEQTNRRITFEYTLIAGVNDSDDHLDALVSYCEDTLCHVNLVPLNTTGEGVYKPSPKQILDMWCANLNSAGITATIRHSSGSDIAAACGQLANQMRD